MRWFSVWLAMAAPLSAEIPAMSAPVSDQARLETRHVRVTPVEMTITDDWTGAGEARFSLPLPALSDDGDFMFTLQADGADFAAARITHGGQAVSPVLTASAQSEGRDISAELLDRNIPLNPYEGRVQDALNALGPAELEQMEERRILRGGGDPNWVYRARLDWQGPATARTEATIRPVLYEYGLDAWIENGRFAPPEDIAVAACIDAPVIRAVQRRLDAGARPADYRLRFMSINLAVPQGTAIPHAVFEVDKTRPEILTAFCGLGEISKTGDTGFRTEARDYRMRDDLQVMFIIPN